MFIIRTNLAIKLDYATPAKSTAEDYQRSHTQNVLNRIAYSYFQQEKHLEDLKKHISLELMLEGMTLPKSVKFG